MQRLTMGILENYSVAYDYNLSEDQIREAYNELIVGNDIVSENDIFDEFDYILKR